MVYRTMIGLKADLGEKTRVELLEMLKKAQQAFEGESEAARILKKGFARKLQGRIDYLEANEET